MRSFSSVWFWIILALAWSSVSQNVMGAPFDLIVKARRTGGQAAEDLNTLVGIFVRRRLVVVRRAGHWVLGFQVMVLTTVCIIGVRLCDGIRAGGVPAVPAPDADTVADLAACLSDRNMNRWRDARFCQRAFAAPQALDTVLWVWSLFSVTAGLGYVCMS